MTGQHSRGRVTVRDRVAAYRTADDGSSIGGGWLLLHPSDPRAARS